MATKKKAPTVGDERRAVKQNAKDINGFLQSDAVLNALDGVARDSKARAAAIADPKKWLKSQKLSLPTGATISLEERTSGTALRAIVGICVTVCILRGGYWYCATACALIVFA